MSARGNGGTYHYYACSGSRSSAARAATANASPATSSNTPCSHSSPSSTATERSSAGPSTKLPPEEQAGRPALEERRRALAEEIRRSERALDRYYEAFESGDLDSGRFQQRVSALETRLAALREQDAELAQQLATEAATAPDTADLEAVADQLERTIAEADPKQAKALLRLLIKDLRVNGRSEILPTYRIVTPEVCGLPSPVGGTGVEPVTSGLSSRRSPS
jgi:site-specific DNA recombinase